MTATASPIELRSGTSKGTVTLTRYASLFVPVAYDIRTGRAPEDTYVEKIARGAFTETLKRPDLDCVFRTEHRNMPLARTSAGNLKLWQDEKGLRYEATLRLDDPDVKALIPKVEAGNMRESSFAFRVPEGGDSWNSTRTVRTMCELDIHRGDVSLVTYGASPETGRYVDLRDASSLEHRAESVTQSGWAGPGVVYRAANQYGRHCESCGDDGKCPDCGGAGWISSTDGDGGQNSVRSSVFIPAARYSEYERELVKASARSHGWRT